MKYIIDANNVAGKLKMLGEEHFDKKFIELVKKINKGKKKEIILVFDGNDPMGDKVTINQQITAVYSPKDGYYQSADDKIVELARLSGEKEDLKFSFFQDEITVVTDDTELKMRLEAVEKESRRKINLESATKFASKLIESDSQKNKAPDTTRGLADEEIEAINQEMLGKWQ